MKLLLTFIIILACNGLQAQDFLHLKTGEVVEVKIFYVSESTDLLGYELNGEKVYRAISSLEKYELNSILTGDTPTTVTAGSKIDGEKAKNFDPKIGRYSYGKWSISTDLASLIAFNRNSIISIEPEYEVNPQFSIKMPVRFGLTNYRSSYPGYYGYGPGAYYAPYISGQPPHVTTSTWWYSDQLIFEIGANPKYYPWHKSSKSISPYIGGSLKAGLWRGETNDNYFVLDTVGTLYYTYWSIIEYQQEIRDISIPFFNVEVLAGIDFVFSRSINLTVEGGFDFKAIHGSLGADTHYAEYFGNPYTEIYSNPRKTNNVNGRLRLLLTYRFNGKLRE